MTFVVRAPSPVDAPEIAALHVSTWRETYAHVLPEGFFDEAHVRGRHEMWAGMLEDPRPEWTIRIADRDGEIIGFAFVGPSFGPDGDEPPRERQLYMIYVAAAHHGTGAGQALFDAVLGGLPAMLWVAKENPRAIAFYRRNGFELDGAEQIDPGAPQITDARMVR